MQRIINFKELCFFEVKSFLGRKLKMDKPKLNRGNNYLNLGCGDTIVCAYVNADFFYKFKFWKTYSRNIEWQLDLRYPLNCRNSIFEGIFTEHTLEHLYAFQVQCLLAELHRVLKPDCIIRITVPDLEKYVSFYTNNHADIDVEAYSKRFKSGCQAIRTLAQDNFHCSVWDFQELKTVMETVGFRDIQKKAYMAGEDPKLLLDKDGRRWETLYVEAKK
ncbi:MAG: methyltransferase domain-containing protein [Desulfobacterales bacterium]|nr:methyltransferase domain-containing protein [Desulfobacterales bacterium]